MACYVFNFNLHDLNLVEIGKQKCTPLYSFGPFIRNEYIFHYVISGKGFCSMGHDIQESSVQKPDQPSGGPTAHEVRAGEGFLIEPHTKHIYNADLNDPWHYIWVVFSGASAPHLLRACQYVSTYYATIQSLDEIAVYCNISQSHLTRLFRESFHMSLQEYLITARLNRAKKLLVTTNQSISEISWAVGYPNELNLLRAFKSRYGISPKEFRQKNRL